MGEALHVMRLQVGFLQPGQPRTAVGRENGIGCSGLRQQLGDDADQEHDSFTVWCDEAYGDAASTFFAGARHPQLDRPYSACAYALMIELLRYLESKGFATFIASGGDRVFMRPIAERL